jgi:glutathione S-transferase
MTTARLYSQGMNPFSEKVICGLSLKGVDFVRVEVTEADEIKRLSPDSQLLPVLELAGKRVSDSAAILQWLEELFPAPSLYSDDPKSRQQQQNLADWSDSSFAWYWNRWRTARDEHERALAQQSPGLLSRLHQKVERKIGLGSNVEIVNEREQEIMVEIASRLDDLVGFLGGREYFYGERPSVADISVYGMCLIMREGPMPGSAEMLGQRSSLVEHSQRISRISRL